MIFCSIRCYEGKNCLLRGCRSIFKRITQHACPVCCKLNRGITANLKFATGRCWEIRRAKIKCIACKGIRLRFGSPIANNRSRCFLRHAIVEGVHAVIIVSKTNFTGRRIIHEIIGTAYRRTGCIVKCNGSVGNFFTTRINTCTCWYCINPLGIGNHGCYITITVSKLCCDRTCDCRSHIHKIHGISSLGERTKIS